MGTCGDMAPTPNGFSCLWDTALGTQVCMGHPLYGSTHTVGLPEWNPVTQVMMQGSNYSGCPRDAPKHLAMEAPGWVPLHAQDER